MFKYETHLHTMETSACGRSSGADMARYFAGRGYTGIIVTDHFFNGSCRVDRSLPWDERVTAFLAGYESAKTEGDKLGLDVFFAWEYSYKWAHLLTYGVGADWLYAHPDILDWDVAVYCDKVHEAGGYIFHAHPFRKTGCVDIRLLPERTDAVEIINAARPDDENALNRIYSEMYDFPVTAGSDIHATSYPRLGGVLSDVRFADTREYAMAVMNRQVRVFCENADS